MKAAAKYLWLILAKRLEARGKQLALLFSEQCEIVKALMSKAYLHILARQPNASTAVTTKSDINNGPIS